MCGGSDGAFLFGRVINSSFCVDVIVDVIVIVVVVVVVVVVAVVFFSVRWPSVVFLISDSNLGLH